MVKLLTVKETAERLRTTEGALRYAIGAGRAPKSGKVGGRRMFRESDVEEYINAAFAD